MVLRGLSNTVGCAGGSGSDIALLQVLGELQRRQPVVVTTQITINPHMQCKNSAEEESPHGPFLSAYGGVGLIKAKAQSSSSAPSAPCVRNLFPCTGRKKRTF